MNEKKTNSPTAEQIAVALRNQVDPDRGRRAASRLYETLTVTKSPTIAAMQIYARLHGTQAAKS